MIVRETFSVRIPDCEREVTIESVVRTFDRMTGEIPDVATARVGHEGMDGVAKCRKNQSAEDYLDVDTGLAPVCSWSATCNPPEGPKDRMEVHNEELEESNQNFHKFHKDMIAEHIDVHPVATGCAAAEVDQTDRAAADIVMPRLAAMRSV